MKQRWLLRWCELSELSNSRSLGLWASYLMVLVLEWLTGLVLQARWSYWQIDTSSVEGCLEGRCLEDHFLVLSLGVVGRAGEELELRRDLRFLFRTLIIILWWGGKHQDGGELILILSLLKELLIFIAQLECGAVAIGDKEWIGHFISLRRRRGLILLIFGLYGGRTLMSI